MSVFGSTTSSFANRSSGIFGSPLAAPTQSTLTTPTTNQQNLNNDLEIPQPPDDTVSALKFNPQVGGMPILLGCGAWDNTVRVWMINETTGAAEAKAMQSLPAPILDIDWSEDSSKLFIVSADKQARVWDLNSNQMVTIGQHDEPIKICHWVVAPNYSCLMTGGWDRTLRFWDIRQLPTQSSLATIQLPERVYCSDLLFPMSIVGLANRHMKIYKLDGQPQEISDQESPLKFQSRCVSIFRNKLNNQPAGYALGSTEGRVAIQCVEAINPKDNFTFKCHRSADLVNNYQEIFPVNDVVFHPIHYTLATVGSDGRYSFWDKDSRTKLKTSEPIPLPITKCHIHAAGNIFAYATGYDWSRGHEGNVQGTGSKIYLHACGEDMKAKPKK